MSGKYPFYSLSGRTDIEGEQMRPSVAESQTRKMIFECKKRREKNVFGQFGKNVCSRGKVFFQLKMKIWDFWQIKMNKNQQI